MQTLDQDRSRTSAVCPVYMQKGLGMYGASPSSLGSRVPMSSEDWDETWDTRDSCDGVGEVYRKKEKVELYDYNISLNNR